MFTRKVVSLRNFAAFVLFNTCTKWTLMATDGARSIIIISMVDEMKKSKDRQVPEMCFHICVTTWMEFAAAPNLFLSELELLGTHRKTRKKGPSPSTPHQSQTHECMLVLWSHFENRSSDIALKYSWWQRGNYIGMLKLKVKEFRKTHFLSFIVFFCWFVFVVDDSDILMLWSVDLTPCNKKVSAPRNQFSSKPPIQPSAAPLCSYRLSEGTQVCNKFSKGQPLSELRAATLPPTGPNAKQQLEMNPCHDNAGVWNPEWGLCCGLKKYQKLE